MILTTVLSSPIHELSLGISWAEAWGGGFCADIPFPGDRDPPLISLVIDVVPA